LADALTGRTRLPVAIEVAGQADPPAEVKIACYRITQEAFNNIAKHAAADQVSLTLRQSLDQIDLAISDNGRGFDPAGVAADHMGLAIMRERARSIGAELNVQSAPGQGAQIHLAWTKGEEKSR
jgi:signal transduction histidine kinase